MANGAECVFALHIHSLFSVHTKGPSGRGVVLHIGWSLPYSKGSSMKQDGNVSISEDGMETAFIIVAVV